MSGYEVNIVEGNKPLFVAFGGIAMQMHMPPFEFKNFLTKNFGDINFLFIRDKKQSWYFNGIDELSNNYEENLSELKKLISSFKTDNIIFVGNSMGAFASILYGIKLNVSHVLAFSPQAFIDKESRNKYGDTRWFNEINNLHKKLPLHKYYNLGDLKNDQYDTKIQTFFGENSKLDVLHSNYFSDFKNMKINIIKDASHGVIKDLKNSGNLQKYFNDLI